MILWKGKRLLQCLLSLLDILFCSPLILAVLPFCACITAPANFNKPKEVPSFLHSCLMAITGLYSCLISYVSVFNTQGDACSVLCPNPLSFGQPAISPPLWSFLYLHYLLDLILKWPAFIACFFILLNLNRICLSLLLCATWPQNNPAVKAKASSSEDTFRNAVKFYYLGGSLGSTSNIIISSA